MAKFSKPIFWLTPHTTLSRVTLSDNVEHSLYIAQEEHWKGSGGPWKSGLVTTNKLFYDVLRAINAEHRHRTFHFTRGMRIHADDDRHLMHVDITEVEITEDGKHCAFIKSDSTGSWQTRDEVLIRNPRLASRFTRTYRGERQAHTTKFPKAMEIYRKYCDPETALEKKEAKSPKLYEGLKEGNRSCENFEAEFEMYCLRHAEELMAMHEGLRAKFDNRYEKYKVIKAMKPSMGTSFLNPQNRHFQKPQSGYELIEHEGKYVVTDFKERRKKHYDEVPPQFKTIVGSFKLVEDGTFIKGMGYVRERGHYWVLPEEWQEP